MTIVSHTFNELSLADRFEFFFRSCEGCFWSTLDKDNESDQLFIPSKMRKISYIGSHVLALPIFRSARVDGVSCRLLSPFEYNPRESRRKEKTNKRIKQLFRSHSVIDSPTKSKSAALPPMMGLSEKTNSENPLTSTLGSTSSSLKINVNNINNNNSQNSSLGESSPIQLSKIGQNGKAIPLSTSFSLQTGNSSSNCPSPLSSPGVPNMLIATETMKSSASTAILNASSSPMSINSNMSSVHRKTKKRKNGQMKLSSTLRSKSKSISEFDPTQSTASIAKRFPGLSLMNKTLPANELGNKTGGIRAKSVEGSTRPKKKMKNEKYDSFNDLVAASKNVKSVWMEKTNDIEFTQKLHSRIKEITPQILTIQRRFRYHLTWRMHRLSLRRNLGAINIQRVYRGKVDREIAARYKAKMYWNATIVQRNYRGYVARCWVYQYREKAEGAATKIQSIARMFLAKKFVKWVRNDSDKAILIQKMVRGFLARCRVRHIKAKLFFENIFSPAVLRIQCFFRRMVALLELRRLQAAYRLEFFEIPAARLIQRVYRGHVGRNIARHQRFLNLQATNIQRIWRSVKPKKQVNEIRYLRKQYFAALAIQCMFRCRLARDVVYTRARKKRYVEKEVPAIVQIQRFIRQMNCRRKAREIALQNRACRMIQNAWKSFLVKQRARVHWDALQKARLHRAATMIQKHWKKYAARALLHTLSCEVSAQRIDACMILQAWWRGVLGRWRAERKKRRALVKALKRQVFMCVKDDMEIQSDEVDIGLELDERRVVHKRCARRIRELNKVEREYEDRVADIEKEMETLDAEEIERGWAEAYEVEFNILSNCLDMLAEEMLGRKIQRKNALEQVQLLSLEQEDLNQDYVLCQEHATMALEAGHRLELNWNTQAATWKRQKRIANQINRWRIPDVRTKVINKYEKKRREPEVAKTIEDRDRIDASLPKPKQWDILREREQQHVKDVTTISYKKRSLARFRVERKYNSAAEHVVKEERKHWESLAFDPQKLTGLVSNIESTISTQLKEFYDPSMQDRHDFREKDMCLTCGLHTEHCLCRDDDQDEGTYY
eukprot:TRINITY_DN162818_c0_g2_i2.p1 TRINITY_DN162818_c0_g2~~TRINITY_DN162818_c0_g2_i2.p1  ORF type:complete len:1063 (+),score=239.27 TRINITY_DN162818_c0_g2_i2:798-3986(+)